jgi:hypothetical protein
MVAQDAEIGLGSGKLAHSIPESTLPLPPSAGIMGLDTPAFRWATKVNDLELDLARTDMLNGEMFFNPYEWRTLSEGQKATTFWHEWSHSQRVLSRPRWMARINRFLYNHTNLGMGVEEFWAMKDALGSSYPWRLTTSLKYAWDYQKLNHWRALAEAAALVGIPSYLGYRIGSDDEGN